MQSAADSPGLPVHVAPPAAPTRRPHPSCAGAFGLLPFMALWQPPQEPPTVPSAKEDLEGWQNLMQARGWGGGGAA